MKRRTESNVLPNTFFSASENAPTNNFSVYAGPWTHDTAAHLLRRATFGPTRELINWSVEQGMEATIEKLFEERPMPDPPVNTYYSNDPNVPIGNTWVDKPYHENIYAPQRRYQIRSLFGWTLDLMFREGISIREKLTLFWHNHFPIDSTIDDQRYKYRYITLLRQHAWGNFRELTKAVTIEPAMLVYLNGNRNTRNSPNENYARELLELFTVGKGPQIAPGDYTHYTEEDVREIARILSGWKDRGYKFESTDGRIGVEFEPALHDPGVKTLSKRFGNTEIPDMGDREFTHLIDIIFQQSEVARFICRKLYRWFVFYEIDEEVEANVIEPMAQLLLEADFEIRPALEALLKSTHFFDKAYVGAMIKSPLDFIMSVVKPLKLGLPTSLTERYDSFLSFVYWYLVPMQMVYYDIPQVAGWRAYYLAPSYYRDWISSTSLPLRFQFVNSLTSYGIYPESGDGPVMKIDSLEVLRDFEDSEDPNSIIEQLAQVLLPKPLQEAQRQILKEALLSGLPDFEWTVEYGNYLQNPENRDLARSVENKVRTLIRAMLSRADFHLG